MRYAFAIATGLALFLSLWRPAAVNASPVLLSFDVEEPGDDLALRQLDVKVPATYFITGQFASSHKEFVSELARGNNTIGSHSYDHPHFRSLQPDAIRNQLSSSKSLLESLSGRPVVWFRAPYLEYDERVLQSLREAGYIGDSSDKDSWANQDTIYELPVSNFLDSSLIASDYDMLAESHYSGKQFTDALTRMYHEKDSSGQPLVILLHPSVSVKQGDALKEFITSVRKSGGYFMSIDGYMASLNQRRPLRRAVWIDAKRGMKNPATTVEELSRLGATDAFLMATDARGKRYFGDHKGRDLFGKTVSLLKSKGIRVHAWVSALADHEKLSKHPDWGMIDKDGARSTEWMSPANPDVVSYVTGSVRNLLRRYRLDGICMDNLAYPNAEFDYSPGIIKAYADHEKIGHIPKLDELLNDDYTSWCAWRSTLIADFAAKTGKVVRREGKGHVEFSTIVPGNSAIDYRAPEISGQNVGLLGSKIDFIVADIPLTGQKEETAKIPLKLFSLHVRGGSKPLLLRFSETAAPLSASPETLSAAACQLKTGSDGISFLPFGTNDDQEKIRLVFKAAAH
jgi:peptidoglycan/xylan/chitin deacetylase (PgdA/CDA1 family)